MALLLFARRLPPALAWRLAVRPLSSSGAPPPPSTADLPASTPPAPPPLSLIHPAFAVWGADTDVGKTLVSAGVAFAAVRDRGLSIRYVKPVQTGWPADSDAATVAGAAGLGVEVGDHAGALLPPGSTPSTSTLHGSATTLFAWALPASPAAAALAESRPVPSEEEVAAAVAAALAGAPTSTLALVESAGGPASPGPRDVLQADGAWRALRLPPLLVGSPRLGGVSATLAAAEFLSLRGHGPPGSVVLVAPPGGLPPGHVASLERHLAALTLAVEPGAPPHRLFVLPPCGAAPKGGGSAETGGGLAPAHPDPALAAWLEEARPELGALVDDLLQRHAARVASLEGLAHRAARALWFPFTQHADLPPETDGAHPAITTIDARAGEHLLALGGGAGDGGGTDTYLSLTPLHDSCAAWWTQGIATSTTPSA